MTKHTLRRIALLLGMGASAAFIGIGLAEARGGNHKAKMAEFDKNGDGALDDAERAAMKASFQARREAHHKEMLAKFDKDKDGKLSDAERAELRKQKIAERFELLDADKNGQISRAEFEAGAAKMHGHHRRFGKGIR